jgi:hypothetical protein
MAISNLRPASAFNVAWRGVSTEDLAGEAAARAAADAALQAEIDAEEAARIADVNAEETRAKAAEAALAADIDAASDLARSELLTEPAVSELASMWSTTLTGEPKDRANLAASNVVFDGVDGLVIRVTAAGNRAPRAAYRMVPGHKYEVLAVARRKVDPVDSTDKTVRLRAMWLTASKAQISAVDLESFALLGSGLHIYRKVVSLVAGSEVDVVAAAGTVYFTPFIQTFGTDGTTNILPYIRVTDLTSNTLVSADVSGLDARLTALESQDLDDRLTAVESLVAGSDIARFETRAKAVSAASAGSILAGVDVLETLGLADGGDDVVRSYSRELADPGAGDRFHDAGGSWWVGRAQGMQGVKGMVELRGIAPVAGRIVHLNYHTTAGDYGAGQFYGVTGAAAGTHVDNDGTIIVPAGGDGSAAWLRVWDHVRAHVGWFGAKCDPGNIATDDYIPVKKCFGLFTDGRYSAGITAGIVDVGPGFCFSQPLVYGGTVGSAFRLVGHQSNARGGQEKSLLRYTGPATPGAIIFYGANAWAIENINTYPQLALNGIVITADNTYNNTHSHTTTHPINAGSNVVVTPSGANAAEKIIYLQPGSLLGVDAGGDNFEIVYITAVNTTVGTFTADFAKNHVSGVMLGGSAPSSGGRVNRCRLLCPVSPVWTTLSADSTSLGPDASGRNVVRFPLTSITGIKVGTAVRVGQLVNAEIVYPLSINTGSKYFDAYSNLGHPAGEIVMNPTAGILFGNRLTATVQVSEVAFHDVDLTGADTSKSYAGIRQYFGGNVKNFTCHLMFASNIRVPFAFESPSGQYVISGGVSGNVTELLILCPGGHLSVYGWEDESYCAWLIGQSGANPSQASFIGCTMQGATPDAAYDQIVVYSGALAFIGCSLSNNRVADTSLPILTLPGIRIDNAPASLALINCEIRNATLANMNFVQDVPLPGGGGVDVIKDGTGKLMMLNCIGGHSGSIVRLPDIIPPLKGWEASEAYNPPSVAAGAVAPAGSVTVPGTVMGDLVEASFSLDLQNLRLSAWVSAANTVKYQLFNPTTGAIALPAGGTVKCRVKK